MRAKAWLINLALVTVSSLAGLLIAEAGYRLWLGERHGYSVSRTGNQYAFYQFDPRLGWTNMPGATGTFTRGEYEYPVSINGHGLRQGPVSKDKPGGIYRIAVLGDSYAWGIGIDDDRRFTELLAGLLPGVEVLNFGTSGYAPVQYHLMLDDVIAFRPDLLVLIFCLGNDFADNVLHQRYGYYKPYARLDESGGLLIEGYPLPDVRKFGYGGARDPFGSRLLGALRSAYLSARMGQRGLAGFSNELVYRDDGELSDSERSLKAEALRINEALLGAMAEYLAARGVRFMVASAPTKREYNANRDYGHEDYYLAAEGELGRSAGRLGIAFLPNARKLHGDDFWVDDGHWNPSGHRKMAASLAGFIRTRGLVTAGEATERGP